MAVLKHRVDRIESDNEQALAEIRRATRAINDAVQQMVKLQSEQTHHAEALVRAFVSIEDLGTRVRAIEDELPTLKLVRRWILGLAGSNFAVVAVVLWFGAKWAGFL